MAARSKLPNVISHQHCFSRGTCSSAYAGTQRLLLIKNLLHGCLVIPKATCAAHVTTIVNTALPNPAIKGLRCRRSGLSSGLAPFLTCLDRFRCLTRPLGSATQTLV
jgi:hypothetical protein